MLYVTKNAHVVYYNAQVEGKNRADEFLVNICTQLLGLLGTREITSLPDNVTQGSWFLSLLLQKISDLLEPDRSCIIAIDALDAWAKPAAGIDLTTLSPGSNLFYLPRYLPERVYFLLARRPFVRDKTGFLVETPFETLDLEDFPESNRDDVQVYIRQTGERLHLPAGGDEEFIEQLTERSENNFMYLAQILPAIADGSLPPFDFTSSGVQSIADNTNISPSPHLPISPSPHLPISPSPPLPISPSPHLPISLQV